MLKYKYSCRIFINLQLFKHAVDYVRYKNDISTITCWNINYESAIKPMRMMDNVTATKFSMREFYSRYFQPTLN